MSADNGQSGLTCFAADYTRGPRWEELRETREELRKAHIEYQLGHFVAGRLLMGGPYTDREFGLALFKTETKEQTMRIVSNDQAVDAGVYSVDVCTWRVVHNAFTAV